VNKNNVPVVNGLMQNYLSVLRHRFTCQSLIVCSRTAMRIFQENGGYLVQGIAVVLSHGWRKYAQYRYRI
ncbi:TPA: hypothetical protein ACQVLR_002178, partial [Serratia marcescens]